MFKIFYLKPALPHIEMLRVFRRLCRMHPRTTPPLPPIKKCHRIDCPCVQDLRKNMMNVIRTTEGYAALEESTQKYKECYALYKKWHL